MTDRKLYTLMHDPQYRVEVARQQTTYNQPSYPSFYLASDIDWAAGPTAATVSNRGSLTTDLAGTTALVTGGGVGIGREIALRLARAGARVAVTYRTHEPDRELADALGGAEAVMLPLDATAEAEVVELAADLGGRFGTLDVLVNNAGGLVQRATLPSSTPSCGGP